MTMVLVEQNGWLALGFIGGDKPDAEGAMTSAPKGLVNHERVRDQTRDQGVPVRETGIRGLLR